MLATTRLDSPLGPLRAVMDDGALVGLSLPAQQIPPPRGAVEDARPFAPLRDWLDAYFAGSAEPFTGAVAPAGTPFQEDVWRVLRTVPHGATVTYGWLARRVGRPRGAQAVGAANGANPVAIVVPCHRVVGASGALTGYAGGLDAKRALLALEGAGPVRGARDLFADAP